jgi:sensor c-di-GMP phosphodiesterase-like protein
MCKHASLLIAGIVSLLAVLAPVGGAHYYARMHSEEDQMERAGLLADDVLRRSEETSNQMGAAFAQLRKAFHADPCSADMIRKMASIDVASSMLQAVGYAEHDRLLCSSLGRHPGGLALGTPDYITSHKVAVRNSGNSRRYPACS